MPSRRTLALGILPPARSMETSLRHPACASVSNAVERARATPPATRIWRGGPSRSEASFAVTDYPTPPADHRFQEPVPAARAYNPRRARPPPDAAGGLRAAKFGRGRMPVPRGKNLRTLDGELGNHSFRGRICRVGGLCLTRAAPASMLMMIFVIGDRCGLYFCRAYRFVCFLGFHGVVFGCRF